MTFDPNWIVAIVGVLGLLGGLWKVASAVGQNTMLTKEILKNQNAQWKKIDGHGDILDDHGNRIRDLESWKKYHEKENQ